ncbi:rhicadhesin receptor-like [Selaginella moellendorffii]|uniref:rhicadhesin receptor-like n=1 Tax=Selaginella moellendorffii TaxID=88036 RepID=UPI000D1C3F6A|nr:rhicadhesin receptor-like [Selaginella moellendorffii]|eukprot:XP_024518764.1 rhicadhesin receptor-like [Selaginella moellendorffii]
MTPYQRDNCMYDSPALWCCSLSLSARLFRPTRTPLQDFCIANLTMDLTFGTVQLFPGLGLSIGRLDFALGGIIVPHTHPRASELVYVEEGGAHAAIITSDSRLYARVITKGEGMRVSSTGR